MFAALSKFSNDASSVNDAAASSGSDVPSRSLTRAPATGLRKSTEALRTLRNRPFHVGPPRRRRKSCLSRVGLFMTSIGAVGQERSLVCLIQATTSPFLTK
jgi:hypothetical protein